MYTQQRRLGGKQREGGQNYISWRTSEPLKRWSLVFSFFFFLIFAGAELCGLDLLRSGKTVSQTAEKSFRFCIGFCCVSYVSREEHGVFFLVVLWGTQDGQGHETCGGERGEAPFKAGLSNLSNPILSCNPPKTSIAYISYKHAFRQTRTHVITRNQPNQ